MSTGEPSRGSPNGRERHRRYAGEDQGPVLRWLLDTIYHGLFQVWFLGLPVLGIAWLVQSPALDVSRGMVVTWLVVSVGVGVRRHGVAGLGGAWPTLDRSAFGGGEGVPRLLARSVYWSTTFAVAGFGGALAGRATGTGHANSAIAAGIGLAAVALLPALVERTRRARLVRLAMAVVGIGLGAVAAGPLGYGTGEMLLLFVPFAALVLVDVSQRPGRRRRR